MIDIHVISPIAFETHVHKHLGHLQNSQITLSHSYLDKGPVSIESDYDEYFAAPGLVSRAIEAEKAGASAIVINCMRDPALTAVQEAVTIPVLGCGQTAMHYAAMLGHKFSVVPTLERSRAAYHSAAIKYGLASKLASVRPTNIPVREIDTNPQTLERLIQCISEAVIVDNADVIILGCTHFTSFAPQVTIALQEKGLDVPLISSLPLTFLTAATVALMGLRHSKKAFPLPLDKELVGYLLPSRPSM